MPKIRLPVASATASIFGRRVAGRPAAATGQKAGAPKGDSGRHESSRPYHEEHGTKFEGGYFYKGGDHSHWTYRYWWGRYGCYTHYCPSTCCWYYWYAKDDCYCPVSYIMTATPAAGPAPADVEAGVKQIVNVTNNSPGAGAAGAPPPPPPMPPAPPGP